MKTISQIFLVFVLTCCSHKINIKDKVGDMNILNFDIRDFELAVGLNVIDIPKHDSSGLASMQIWVKAGSADETENLYGGAHLLEHMIFKGSERKRTGDVADAIEKVGGYINAWTSFEETVYWTVIPVEHLDIAFQIFSDVIWSPKMDKSEFEREREVVLEELRRGEDMPSVRLDKRFFEVAYKGHRYGHPVIGYKEVLSIMTPEDLSKFHSMLYNPKNSFIIVSGDINTEEIIKKAEKYFKFDRKYKDKDTKSEEIKMRPDFRGAKSFIIRGKEKEAKVEIGFLTYPYSNTLSVRLDIASEILDERLTKLLRLNLALVNSIDVWNWSPEGTGMFGVSIELDSANLQRSIFETLTELKVAKTDGFFSDEVDRAKTSILSSLLRQTQKVDSLGILFGRAEKKTGNWKDIYEYISLLEKVTPKDIWESYNEILDMNNLIIGIYLNEKELETLSSTDIEKASREVLSGELKDFFVLERGNLGAQKYKTKNGTKIILKPIRGVGITSISAVTYGGISKDGEYPGLSNFVANMLTRGTEKRSAESILVEMQSIGGDISGFSGKDSVGLSSSFLSKYLENGISIFFDVLLFPTFPESEIQKVRKDIIEELRTRNDLPSTQAFDEFAKELFEGIPYSFPPQGKAEVVNELTRNDLIGYWKSVLSSGKLVITLAGDFEEKEILRILSRYIKLYEDKYATKEIKAEIKKLDCEKIRKKQKFIERDSEQTHIIVGFCGPDVFSEDKYALDVLSSVLSGQGGRLFSRLREEKGLAYVVAPVKENLEFAGFFGAYIASSPQKTDESLQGLKEELERVKNDITEDDIKRGKNIIFGGLKRSLQSTSDWAKILSSNEFFGFGFDYLENYKKKIERVTLEDVKNVAKKYINFNKDITIILGQKEK